MLDFGDGFEWDENELLNWSHDRLFNEVCNLCFELFARDLIDETDSESIMDKAQETDDLGLMELIKQLRKGDYVSHKVA